MVWIYCNSGTNIVMVNLRYAWMARIPMPDHLHWLMKLRGATLAECMSLLKSRSRMYIMANPVRAGRACAVGEHPCAKCRWPL
ncbi:hypothetical protein [Stenotrophomonas maltophilia]|uniref:hypothetical protein n=1 Tax=Stenotrophomonas maltophilia TaxID=40324 RepID=UPI0039C1E42B